MFPASTAFGITSVVDFISRPSTSQSASAVIIKLSAVKIVSSAVKQVEFGTNLSGIIGSIAIASPSVGFMFINSSVDLLVSKLVVILLILYKFSKILILSARLRSRVIEIGKNAFKVVSLL